MAKRIGNGTFQFESGVSVVSYAAIGGKKEGDGPLGTIYDQIEPDSHFGQETWEQAESELQRRTVQLALDKASTRTQMPDCIFAGDLVNQCISSAFGLRSLGIPYMGIYGACSTMAEGLLLASVFIESGAGTLAAAVTSSHFSTAERQYRFPLSYGAQRTPTSQWTCTASGALLVGKEPSAPYVAGATIGRIQDLKVTDANNMGAAMAPAAADTILRYLRDTNTTTEDYDMILTGDLGHVGSQLLAELLEREGVSLKNRHKDGGAMLYDPDQDTHAGASGCGCAASLLCGCYLEQLRTGTIQNLLFAATGALLSPMSTQQGESIPSISHLVHLSAKEVVS